MGALSRSVQSTLVPASARPTVDLTSHLQVTLRAWPCVGSGTSSGFASDRTCTVLQGFPGANQATFGPSCAKAEIVPCGRT